MLFKVMCPYCDAEARLVSTKVVYGKKYIGKVFLCSNYPACDAYAGARLIDGRHVAIASLADAALRRTRREAHTLLSTLQEKKHLSVGASYAFMREMLHREEAVHIGFLRGRELLECLRLLKRSLDDSDYFYRVNTKVQRRHELANMEGLEYLWMLDEDDIF